MSFLVSAILASSFLFLLAACLWDLRTGEILDEITYGYVACALLISAAASVMEGDASYFISAFVAALVFFAIGFVFFYIGMWGGGDAKLVTGIGASLSFLVSSGYLSEGMFPFYVTYFINMGFLALPYVTVYGLVVGFGKKKTWTEFDKYIKEAKTLALFFLSFIPSTFAYLMDLYPLWVIYLILPPLVVSAIYLKSVERTALRKTIDVKDLKEEDVTAEDVVVDGEKIASKRNISGVTKEDIAKLRELAEKGRIPEKIEIKWGVRFAPVLFITYLSVAYIGNLMELLVETYM